MKILPLFTQGSSRLFQAINTLDGMRASIVAIRLLSSFAPSQSIRTSFFNATNGLLLGTHLWVIQRACAPHEREPTGRIMYFRKVAQGAIIGSAFSMFVATRAFPFSKVRDIAQIVGIGIGAALFLNGYRKEDQKKPAENSKIIKECNQSKELNDLFIDELNKCLERKYDTIANIPKNICIRDTSYELDFPINEGLEKAEELFKAKALQLKFQLLMRRGLIDVELNKTEQSSNEWKKQLNHRRLFVGGVIFAGMLPLLTRNFLQNVNFSKVQTLTNICWAGSGLLLSISERYTDEWAEAQGIVKTFHFLKKEISDLEKEPTANPIVPKDDKNKRGSAAIRFLQARRFFKENKGIIASTLRESTLKVVKALQQAPSTIIQRPPKEESVSDSATKVEPYILALPTDNEIQYLPSGKTDMERNKGIIASTLRASTLKVVKALQQVPSTIIQRPPKEESVSDSATKVDPYILVLPTGNEIQYPLSGKTDIERNKEIIQLLNKLIRKVTKDNERAKQMIFSNNMKVAQDLSFIFSAILPILTKNLPRSLSLLTTVASLASIAITFVGLIRPSSQKSISSSAFFPT